MADLADAKSAELVIVLDNRYSIRISTDKVTGPIRKTYPTPVPPHTQSKPISVSN
jgi:hypothetical protein